MTMNTIDTHIMQQLGAYQQLTANEQRALAQRVQDGDKDAREQLVLSNLRLVIANLKHFPQFAAKHFEDVYQAGVTGLLIAADRYDPERKATFSSYATHWIRQSMRLWIYQQNIIHISKDVHDEAIKLRMSLLRADHEMDSQELASETGLSIDHVEHALHYLEMSCVSLDSPVNFEDEQTWGDITPDESDHFAAIEEENSLIEIPRLLAVLTLREQRIIALAFGLTGRDEMTRVAISTQLGMKSSTVNTIYQRALAKMRRAAGVLTNEKEARAS